METENNLVSELASDPILIGEWTFYPDILQLARDDKNIKLEPRIASLLFHLTQNAGHPVSRDILMEKAWPGMVVGDEALTSAINKLRKAFGDDSHHPEVIETIPKVGYRLIADVEYLRSKKPENETKQTSNVVSSKSSGSHRIYIAIFAVLVVLLVLIVLIVLIVSTPWLPIGQDNKESSNSLSKTLLSNKPTIAVLPFENLSADVDQEYFTDGISEDIITDLSRISNLQVVARSSSFRYKGQALDIEQVIKELGVSHILEGSVRRSGNDLRITARLIDSSNGQNVWAERFDRQLDDIFKVQDDVTQSIVSSLSIKLTKRDREILTQPTTSSFEAYDLFLQGQSLNNERTKEASLQAQETFRQAIILDPEYARAHGTLAVTLTRFVSGGWSESPVDDKNRALELARLAVALDNKSQHTFWALGFIHLFRQEYNLAEEAVRKALVIAPNYADGLALLALINNHLGQSRESIKLINKATLLNPHYSWDYLYNLGLANYTLGNYDKAVGFLLNALERNENARTPRLLLAASYMGLEKQDDAEWEIEEILVRSPKMSLTYIKREAPFTDEEKLNLYLSHLRQAGLPK